MDLKRNSIIGGMSCINSESDTSNQLK
jgi:hypothetical protein